MTLDCRGNIRWRRKDDNHAGEWQHSWCQYILTVLKTCQFILPNFYRLIIDYQLWCAGIYGSMTPNCHSFGKTKDLLFQFIPFKGINTLKKQPPSILYLTKNIFLTSLSVINHKYRSCINKTLCFFC